MTDSRDEGKKPDLDQLVEKASSIPVMRAEVEEATKRKWPSWVNAGIILGGIPLLGYGMAFTFASAYLRALGIPEYFTSITPRFLWFVSLVVIAPFLALSCSWCVILVPLLKGCSLKWKGFEGPDLADLFLYGVYFSSGLLLLSYGRPFWGSVNCLFAIVLILLPNLVLSVLAKKRNPPAGDHLSATEIQEKLLGLTEEEIPRAVYAMVAPPLVNEYELLKKMRPSNLEKQSSQVGWWFLSLVYVGVCMLLLVSFTGGGFVARYRQDFLVFRDSDADMVVLEKVGDWLVVAPLNLQQKTYEPIYRFLPLPSDRTTTYTHLCSRLKVSRTGRQTQTGKPAPQ